MSAGIAGRQPAIIQRPRPSGASTDSRFSAPPRTTRSLRTSSWWRFVIELSTGEGAWNASTPSATGAWTSACATDDRDPFDEVLGPPGGPRKRPGSSDNRSPGTGGAPSIRRGGAEARGRARERRTTLRPSRSGSTGRTSGSCSRSGSTRRARSACAGARLREASRLARDDGDGPLRGLRRIPPPRPGERPRGRVRVATRVGRARTKSGFGPNAALSSRFKIIDLTLKSVKR